jgi:hypothetical protein
VWLLGESGVVGQRPASHRDVGAAAMGQQRRQRRCFGLGPGLGRWTSATWLLGDELRGDPLKT